MIVRQFCARHGRSAFTRSSRPLLRSYASEASDGRPHTGQPSTRQTPVKVTSHPDDPSSILDSVAQAPTPKTRAIEDALDKITSSNKTLEAVVHGHATARIGSLPVDAAPSALQDSVKTTQIAPQVPAAPFENLTSLYAHRRAAEKASKRGTYVSNSYDPLSILRKPPTPEELTLPMLLANQTHLGHHTSLWHPGNSRYIFGVREAIHIISLEETFAHLRRASKVVQEVARRGGIILFIGTRKGQDEIIVNAAKLAQGYHIVDRWVPGSLTNGQQILGSCAIKVVDLLDQEIPEQTKKLAASERPVLKPDLVVCLNTLENEVCLHECGLHNVPTIGVVDTDVNPTWVTYPIPANDDSLRSIALIAGCLGQAGKEGQRLRLESARLGVMTYDNLPVVSTLESIEDLQSMDVRNVETSVATPASIV